MRSEVRAMNKESLSLTVNESEEDLSIEPRLLLSDVLRDELGLTGTKRGCDTAKCGACTVLMDGDPVKSCNMLALQADGAEITTIEGVQEGGELSAVQESFWENYSFQCGFCTPGFIMNTTALIEENQDPTEEEIRHQLKGNICRCTGYVNIIDGVHDAASRSTCGSDD